jgi:hypothetical protein
VKINGFGVGEDAILPQKAEFAANTPGSQGKPLRASVQSLT